MKITIEHEKFTATTEDVEIAKQLCQMAGLIDAGVSMKHCAPISAEMDKYLSEHDGEPLPMTGAIITDDVPQTPKKTKSFLEHCLEQQKAKIHKKSTISKMEIPAAPDLPPFNPAWTEQHVDLDNNYLERYSNPCSTLHGKCGGKCWQTELWLRNKKTKELSVCDVEFYEMDELRGTLDPYVKYTKSVLAVAAANKLPCSRQRLEQIAGLFNAGKSDNEIMETLHLSINSVKTYRAAAKRCGLLTE